MSRKTSSLVVALALLAAAGMIFAQNADPNTSGPAKNTLELRLVEPAEGATISGNSVRVTVAYDNQASAAGMRSGQASFPQPRFDVYLDNSLKATLKGAESNTATIENVPAGRHKIAVVALNASGEVIDRKEVGITATTVAESTTSSSSVSTAPAPAPVAAPPPAPAPIETTLPHTASSSPRLALMGVALLATGLLLGRKIR